jgi:DNA-binding transcriptional regulator YhcF (GntR family)
MIKVLEDALVNKKDSSSSDVSKKETIKSIDDLPSLVGRNLKVLINQANKHGISKKELIKLLNGE